MRLTALELINNVTICRTLFTEHKFERRSRVLNHKHLLKWQLEGKLLKFTYYTRRSRICTIQTRLLISRTHFINQLNKLNKLNKKKILNHKHLKLQTEEKLLMFTYYTRRLRIDITRARLLINGTVLIDPVRKEPTPKNQVQNHKHLLKLPARRNFHTHTDTMSLPSPTKPRPVTRH